MITTAVALKGLEHFRKWSVNSAISKNESSTDLTSGRSASDSFFLDFI